MEKMVPENPLVFIQRCVTERRILWTHHVNMRMQTRSVSRELILSAVATFEVIESYPDDKYLPSYLVYLRSQGNVFHVLFAADVNGGNVRVVTAYRPSPEEWDSARKRRIQR